MANEKEKPEATETELEEKPPVEVREEKPPKTSLEVINANPEVLRLKKSVATLEKRIEALANAPIKAGESVPVPPPVVKPVTQELHDYIFSDAKG